MMIKKRFILVIMIILTFSMSLVNANEDLNNVGYNDGLQVNSTYSEDVLTAPEDVGTFSDLNSNIQANPNISLDKDYKYDSSSDGSLSSGIIIDKDTTVDGASHIINGSNSKDVRLFAVNKGTLTLKNVIITDLNYNADDKGLIYQNGGNLVLDNVTFQNSGYKSLIWADGGSLTVTNSYFINNTATNIFRVSGYNSVFINSNVIMNNNISNALLENGLNVNTIDNNVFINNINHVNIEYIKSCRDNYWGTNAATYGSVGILYKCDFTIAKLSIVGNNTISGDSAYQIVFNNTKLPVFNLNAIIDEKYATLNQNSITVKNGAAEVSVSPKANGVATLSVGKGLIKDSNTKNIKINLDGSIDELWVATTGSDTNDGSKDKPLASITKAIEIAKSGYTIHIMDGEYSQKVLEINKALSFIGEGNNVIIRGTGNRAFSCTEDGCNLEFINITFANLISEETKSAALYIEGDGFLKVINCTFKDIGARYGAMDIGTTADAEIKNCTFENVVGTASRSAIIHVSGSGEYIFDGLTISNSKLADNVVENDKCAYLRGIFYIDNQNAVVTLNNTVIRGSSGPMQSVVESRSKLNILNTVIVNNTVGMTSTGFGQYLIYGSSANANINIKNTVISNNTAGDSSESEIFQLTNGNTLDVSYSSIVDNKVNKIFNVKSGNAAVTMDYNWWGNNTVSNDKISKWIIMTTPENITAQKGKTIDVEVYFNHYTDASGKIYDLSVNVPITVKFSTINGTLLNNVAYSVNGIASVPYTVNNNDTITVKSGNQTATIKIISKVIDAIWVSAEGNDANDGSENSPVATIAKAIELAKNSSTIYVMEGSYSQGQITINKEVSITGLGKVILTNNAFICKADNVEFNNIVFSQNDGSAVLKVYGNNIKIYNCTFSNINADLGVLYLSSGSVDIVNTVINNVNSRYLISISKNAILKMSNSVVDGNNLENSIFYLGDGSSLNVDYCIITNNRFVNYTSVEEDGKSEISLDYNWWGTNTPAGKDIKNWVIMNAPESISGEKCETINVNVDFNHYMGVDGKIHTLTKHIPETAVDFDGNILNTVNGLVTFSYTIENSNKIVVKSANQSSVIDVIIKEVKRDVWVSKEGNDENNGSQTSPVATIKKALELVSDGYSIYIAPGTYLEYGLEITKSVNIIGSGKVIIDADNNGKIISTTNKSAVINLANLELTKAKSNFGCAVYNLGADFTLNNISIYDNEITDALANTMSAIYNTGVMTIKNSKIIHNIGHGLIYNSNNLALINSTVSGNDIASGTSSYGIVYSTGGTVKIVDSDFDNNIARLGTVYISNGNLIVENSIFESNRVTVGNGGAITLWSLSSKVNITNATFRDNMAAKDGGAILARGDVNILNSIFEDNAAGNGYYGNAIYNYGNLNIHYSVLLENASSNYVIYNCGYNPSANAQYNWWGTNNDPSKLVGAGKWDEDTPCEDVDVSNWIIMSVTPNIIENITGNQVIKATFDKYQGNDGKLYDLTKTLPEFNVKFSAINGTLSDNLAKVINNAASVNYTISDNDTITVESGNEIFNIKVIVAKETSIILINVNDIVVGENATIDVFVNKNATGNVVVSVNNKNTTVNIKDGKASLIVSDLPVGKYDIVVKYSGDANYGASTNITSFNVGKIAKYDIDVDISRVQSGENATITVSLPKDATGNVTIIIGNKMYNATVVNGTAKITTDVLDNGTYNVVVSYSGDNNYVNYTKQLNMTVDINKNVNLKANDIVMFYKDGSRFTAVLTDYKGNPIANETLIFVINGVNYTKITDNKGTASMALKLMPGVYEGLVLFNGTSNYNNISVKCNITIKSTVIGHDIVKMFRNATQYSALFLDSNGKALVNATVKFNINGVFYTKNTNGEGIATLNIQLLPKEYIITNYNLVTGEENSNKVTVKSLLVGNSDLVKYYLNESGYTLKVIGKDGKIAAGQEVTFNINGVFYHRVSDDNGIVSLGIKLLPGTYIVTAEYEGCRVSNSITVLPTLITKDLDMKYLDGSNFTAQTLDGQGKALANQNVSFNVNGVFYHKTTDENGIANLNIRLNPGKYIITSIWNEYQVGNNITIA